MKTLFIGLILSLFFNQTVVEEFVITDVNESEIRGEINWSTWHEGQGEGIYFEKNVHSEFEDLKVGDVIQIEWKEEDYSNGSWEKIHKVERR